jgi:large subunit ribosomal protein L20
MSGLHHATIDLNRKMLSEIAIADPQAFDALVAIALEHAKTPAAAA